MQMKKKKNLMIQKPKMLIVEDKAGNRYVLKSIFEEDYEIAECADGRAAIELLEEERDAVSVVLLDIVMPVCDGFAVLEYMKKTALDTVPVILISSNVDDNNIQKAYGGLYPEAVSGGCSTAARTESCGFIPEQKRKRCIRTGGISA